MKKHKIDGVMEGSIAEELEIVPGDLLLTINKKEIEDIFDYQYLVNDSYLEIEIEKENHEVWILEVEKDYEEDLGLCFGESLMDAYRSCHNKCVFCFIDQNPPGMRETIYFKDDDTRLSFLQGNYVSLTNMKEKDIERIIEYKLAPINISVHTTNEALRCEMLHNRFAGKINTYMKMLYEAGIPMNAQIVLCKNYNDGKELEHTIEDLLAYTPIMESLSVVPVGLSKYRDGLCELESFGKDDAREVIKTVEHYQKLAMEKVGNHFVHASDEWYITAELPFPDEDNYDGYIQLENGVGMTRLLYDEIDEEVRYYLEEHENKPSDKKGRVVIITGVLAEDIMNTVVDKLRAIYPEVSFVVKAIVNHFFGEKITVTGLLTAKDMIEQLKDIDLGCGVILPSSTLKADEDIFLDDVTLEDFQNALQVPVIIVQSSGADFVQGIEEALSYAH